MMTATAERDAKYYGIAAEFDDPDRILSATKLAHEAGYRSMDAYTPFPIHGLDDAMAFKCTKVQWTIFIMGVLGCCAGLGLEYYAAVIDYPLNVGGRPLFSWPSFIPVAYECTILFAALAAVIGVFAFNGLPRPNHPIFNAPRFNLASRDRFFLCIEATDAQFDRAETRRFLEGLGAVAVSDVYADEEVGS